MMLSELNCIATNFHSKVMYLLTSNNYVEQWNFTSFAARVFDSKLSLLRQLVTFLGLEPTQKLMVCFS